MGMRVESWPKEFLEYLCECSISDLEYNGGQ